MSVRHDARHPLTKPSYPAKDIREGNEGIVELELYVLPSGRIGDVRVLKSTGSQTLDQSAVDEAKRRWRMLPATRDGEPYAQWHRLKVTFSLQDR
jgi:protein TonB